MVRGCFCCVAGSSNDDLNGSTSPAIRAGALGKDNHERAVVQRGLNVVIDLADMGAPLTVNEQCPAQLREQSHDRPRLDFTLGDEHGGRE